jgi:hypothetical protein
MRIRETKNVIWGGRIHRHKLREELSKRKGIGKEKFY